MDLTKRDVDGTIYGLKINYSLFYKYENFLNKLKSCNYLRGWTCAGPTDKDSHVEGKEHLSLGSEYIYLFNKNDYITSCTAKVMVSDSAVRLHKNYAFKRCGDYFNSLNLAVKLSV